MPPPPPNHTATSIDKGHGRLEKRTIRTTTNLTKHDQWSGLQQGFELTRERTTKGKKTVEVVHGITSLAEDKADAQSLLELTRDHWGIENGLHYRRDVTLAEDASRVRKGTAPQVMAALRNTIIHILSEVAAPSLAAAMRTMNNCFAKALKILGVPQLE